MPDYGIIRDLKTRIQEKLGTISGLTTYIDALPETGYKLPACVISYVGGAGDREVGCGTLNPFRTPVLQLDVWALTMQQADGYADEVQATMYANRFSMGSVSGGTIKWMHAASEPREIARAGVTDPFHVTMDWEAFVAPSQTA
jgi:hypothetical protein